jgi:endonuclease/exonuclease/phosphatase family metal-dependent hydrolase
MQRSRLAAISLGLLLSACGPSGSDAGIDASLTSPNPGANCEEGNDDSQPGGQQRKAVIRVGTYNIRHADLASLNELGDALKPHHFDMVALQESDFLTERSGGENQAFRIGQRIGRAASLRTAKEVDGGHLANALLYHYPLLSNIRVELPQVEDELRVLAIFELEVAPDLVVNVGVAHLSIVAVDRALQVDAVIEAMAGRRNPILLGDFNERPTGENMAKLFGEYRDAWAMVGADDGYTFPSNSLNRRIDYVLLGPGWPDPESATVLKATTSDHLPLLVEVALPAD